MRLQTQFGTQINLDRAMRNEIVAEAYFSAQFLSVIAIILLSIFCSAAYSAERLGPELTRQARLNTTAHDAEVLYSIAHLELEDGGHWKSVQYVSIRINTLEAARDYGRMVLPYNHYYSQLTLDFARVLDKKGAINELAEDAIQTRVTGGGQDFYSDSSELVFSLPDISPGSILEFQYSRKSKKLALPELFSNRITPYHFQKKIGNDGWRSDYVAHFSYQITHLTRRPLYQKSYMGFPSNPTSTTDGVKTTKIWNMTKVPQLVTESWMPPLHKVVPELFISTHKDWSVIDKWAWGKIHDKIVSTNDVKQVVKKLKLDKYASDQEKIQAVYEYLQLNVRYVFAHLGRGGYEPHFSSEVIQQSYGDCKDQTVLAISLLNQLGINALPALVQTPHSGRSDTPMVDLIFDHMIVYIPKAETHDAVWMDTTGDRSLFPGVSNYLIGQNAFIVNGQGGKLTLIDGDFPHNLAQLNMEYKISADGFSQVNAEIQLSGYFEENIRNWWKHDTNRTTSLNQFASAIFPKTTDYEFKGSVINTENLWQPAVIKGSFVFNEKLNEETPPSFATSLAQIIQLFGGYSELQLPQERQNRFSNHYPSALELNAYFYAPKETTVAVVDTGSDIVSHYFSLKQNGKKTDYGYEVKLTLTRPEVNISASEYKKYFNDTKLLSQPTPWIISFARAPNQEILSELEDIKHSYGKNSFEYFLAQTKQLIKNGDFQKALEPAQQAVEKKANSGEAWYYLGMAQGLNSMIDESQKSFELAAELGYLP